MCVCACDLNSLKVRSENEVVEAVTLQSPLQPVTPSNHDMPACMQVMLDSILLGGLSYELHPDIFEDELQGESCFRSNTDSLFPASLDVGTWYF